MWIIAKIAKYPQYPQYLNIYDLQSEKLVKKF